MHMADALVSPAVGGVFWGGAATALAVSSRRLRHSVDDGRMPLMGVLAAFIFAAQMINFTIPGTGSSGHLGGGMILAILLGPWAGLIAMASVLTVQSLFFADGGLLALGCNIVNLGVVTCFVAYPLIYRRIAGPAPGSGRLLFASLASAIFGLQLGAFGVVIETALSGITSLPISSFLMVMQPIHLAIGIVEGVVTAAVVSFILKARPDLASGWDGARPPTLSMRQTLAVLTVAAFLTGGVLSWFASEYPDGLEWSIARLTGETEVVTATGGVHAGAEEVQKSTALMPDYNFKGGEGRVGTSAAGLIGGVLTLGAVVLVLFLVKKFRRRGCP